MLPVHQTQMSIVKLISSVNEQVIAVQMMAQHDLISAAPKLFDSLSAARAIEMLRAPLTGSIKPTCTQIYAIFIASVIIV